MTNGPIKKYKSHKSLLQRANDWANSDSIAEKLVARGTSRNKRVNELNAKEEKKYKGRRSSAKKALNQK